ncbi:MAG: hypothetical protein CMJ88_05475 [Planctomycetes bacterium]|nr:hypothetical protein [Planctomycetota bacterium]
MLKSVVDVNATEDAAFESDGAGEAAQDLDSDAMSEDEAAATAMEKLAARAGVPVQTTLAPEPRDRDMLPEGEDSREDDGHKLEKDKQIFSLIQYLWPCLLTIAAVVTVLLSGFALYKALTKPQLTQCHVADCQVKLLLVLLMLCPLLRAKLSDEEAFVHFIVAMRSAIEGALFIILFCTLPSLAIGFTRRAAEAPLPEYEMHDSHGPTRDFPLNDEVRKEFLGDKVFCTDEARRTEISQLSEVLGPELYQSRRRILILMGARTCILLSYSTLMVIGLIPGSQEGIMGRIFRQISAVCSATLLFMALWVGEKKLSLSSLYGDTTPGRPETPGKVRNTWLGKWFSTGPMQYMLQRAWNVTPSFFSQQRVIALLPLTVVCIEVVICLLIWRGMKLSFTFSELLSCVVLILGVATTGLYFVMMGECKVYTLWASRQKLWPETIRGYVSKLVYIFTPMRPFEVSTDQVVALADDPELLDTEIHFCCEATREEAAGVLKGTHEVRSIWRGVLFDIFSVRVRSKLLAICMITLVMSRGFIWYLAIVESLNDVFYGGGGEDCVKYLGLNRKTLPDYCADNGIPCGAAMGCAQAFIFIAYSFFSFVAFGILMVGNNVYMSKHWLFLALPGFLYMLVKNCEIIARPDKSQNICVTHPPDISQLHQVLYIVWATVNVCLSILGMYTVVKTYARGEEHGDFYMSSQESNMHVARLLSASSREEDPAHKELHHSDGDYPAFLISGAAVSLPVLIGFAFLVVYIAKVMLRYTEIAQNFVQALNGTADAGEMFRLLDVNYDNKVSMNELSIDTGLTLLGKGSLSEAIRMLWRMVQRDSDEKRLNLDEARDFLKNIYVGATALRALTVGNINLASEALVRCLDKSPEDGALSEKEMPMGVLQAMMYALSPDFASLLGNELTYFWRESDLNGDGKLDQPEVASFIRRIKERAYSMTEAMSNATMGLIKGARDAFNAMPKKNANLTVIVELRDKLRIAQAEAHRRHELVDVTDWLSDVGIPRSIISNVTAAFASALLIATQGSPYPAQTARGAFTTTLKVFAPSVYDDALLWLAKPEEDQEDEDADDGDDASEGGNDANDSSDDQGNHDEIELSFFQMESRTSFMSSQQFTKASQSATVVQPALERLRAVDPVLAKGISKLVAEMIIPMLEGVARGVVFLKALQEPPRTCAEFALKRLDTDGDRRLNADELGLTFALALFSPSLTSMAPTVMKLVTFGKKDSKGEYTIGKKEVGVVMYLAQAVLRDYIGDIDGDGEVSDADLAVATDVATGEVSTTTTTTTTTKMTTTTEEEEEEEEEGFDPESVVDPYAVVAEKGSDEAEFGLLQVPTMRGGNAAHRGLAGHFEQGLLLQREHVNLRRMLQKLQQDPAEAVAPSSEVVSGGSGMRTMAETAILRVVKFFTTMDLRRIEYCLYFSVLFALAVAMYTVTATFKGYKKMFRKCQKGDYHFQGGHNFKKSLERPDNATFFPGMLLSTCIFCFLTVFSVLFIFLCFATSWFFVVEVLCHYLGPLVLGVFITWLVQLILLRIIGMSWFCMERGEVVRPRVFSMLLIMLSITNFAMGIFAIVPRFAIVPIVLTNFFRLDTTLVGKKWQRLDPGFQAFVTTTALSYEKLNPVRRAFISQLMTQSGHLYGPKAEGQECSTKVTPRHRRLQLRNKWWLATILSRNNSLIAERRFENKEMKEP